MRERAVAVALSNSFGFGGHNVTLAVRRFDG
jgi:3-oxoacyl-(acyl-carrier-protein) synthase